MGLRISIGPFAALVIGPMAWAVDMTGVGFDWSSYTGPPAQYISTSAGPGVNFNASWRLSPEVDLLSKVELVGLFGGEEFGSATTSYAGFGILYKLQPHFIIYKEGTILPYLSPGLALGGFGLVLAAPPTSSGASNNQASAKYGFTLGIGADFVGKGGSAKGSAWNLNIEYFRFLATPSKFRFQGGEVGARGVQISFTLMFPERGRGKGR